MPNIITDIIITPGKVWYAPVGEAFPAEDVAYDAAWGGNWAQLGYTVAPVSIGYSFETVDKTIEQSLARVGGVKSSEELMLETTLAEMSAAVAKLAFGAGTITTVAAGASQHGYETLDVGDDFALDLYAWGFEGYYFDTAGDKQPIRFFIYSGAANAGGQMEFGKAVQTGIPLQIKAIADMTQAVGSRLFQLHRVTAEPTA